MKAKTIPLRTLVAASLIPLLAAAQVPNPFQSARDAYNKAKQQLQQVGQPLPAQSSQPTASAAPAAASAPVASAPPPARPSAAPVAAPGQIWQICQYRDMKDPTRAAAGGRMYYAHFPADAAFENDHWKHWNAYIEQNYKIMDPDSSIGRGFCRRSANDAPTPVFVKQWRSMNLEPVETPYADTPAQNAAIDAKLTGHSALASPAANPPSPAPSSNGHAKECAAMIARGQKPPPYCSE
jgi:hypothetical protein